MLEVLLNAVLFLGVAGGVWPHGLVKRVVIIGIDGLGGVYLSNITKDHAPTLRSLIDSEECAYTFSARNKNPTVSAPNWSTILTGMPPSGTGIVSNSWTVADLTPNSLVDGRVAPVSGAGKLPPTIFHLAKGFSREIFTASAYAWSWLSKGHDGGPVDGAGHSSYWGSPQYYAALKNVDGYVFKILEALGQAGIEDETLILITSDHGGYRNTHGQWDTANTDTPAIFCSPGKLIKHPGLIERWIDNV
ncbi:hypothetical protein Pmar_PMAR009527 [Perkinsus marinus ATCC 50983]|uniref:Uncharacterized protein n=1 Tax=Perkinsus marinus (strain ATCC 50983 / TXsc) TaxID=423536 RepID=C5KEF5_PERM5|nr:hypothetical protein Pmar_PMAR009527 [Perkinsus marinus ATCC 50983]EER17093.1 hypothetical protein Pmar_PMAR009527 [Perkinsus marinus ATCC 50983]|eukprot:XP_002785297.1 hypothetical protein Pmar_PMAR009527 [Perkinsus marinus ATCC 50983]